MRRARAADRIPTLRDIPVIAVKESPSGLLFHQTDPAYGCDPDPEVEAHAAAARAAREEENPFADDERTQIDIDPAALKRAAR